MYLSQEGKERSRFGFLLLFFVVVVFVFKKKKKLLWAKRNLHFFKYAVLRIYSI